MSQMMLGALCGLAVATACSDPCDSSSGTREIRSGDNPDSLTYVSAPWNDLDAFSAGEGLDFFHRLEVVPQVVLSWVSFSPSATDLSENAGDQGNIECADAERVRLRNNTCQDLFVRVVATAYGAGDIPKPCD